jgi:hypothetical protein
MSMGVALGLSSLYYIWRSSGPGKPSAEKDSLWMATWLGTIYWITQLAAIGFPGTAFSDPEFGETHAQLYLCAGFLSALAVGNWLESTRMARERKVAFD